ncbi:MAG: 2Fe-2S iron-sulfur cluster-binding protein [Gammaproteobacteria bacterium]|nr:2Fe-2S iron-sulfur cluster-binding protein [Gammaproteobacteria bacterium]
MTTINFILADGSCHAVDTDDGDVVMRVAVRSGFSGILAECGGACSCATCHVHIDPSWYDKLPPMDELETEMLDFAEGVDETSRLSCQIKITPQLDGLIVHVPESQY